MYVFVICIREDSAKINTIEIHDDDDDDDDDDGFYCKLKLDTVYTIQSCFVHLSAYFGSRGL